MAAFGLRSQARPFRSLPLTGRGYETTMAGSPPLIERFRDVEPHRVTLSDAQSGAPPRNVGTAAQHRQQSHLCVSLHVAFHLEGLFALFRDGEHGIAVGQRA